MEFPSVRAGALALKERLPSLFAKLIQTNIPSLKASALAHIDDTREQRRRLGDAPLNTAQMISEVQRVLLSPSKEFSETITPFIENFREDVHATEKRVTLDWVGKTYRHDAFKPPFFQSQATFDRCMVEIVDWWKDPAIRLSESVRTALADTLDPLEYETVGVSRCLVNALNAVWKDASRDIMAALDAGVAFELKREVAFGTANHYLTDKYAEAQILPNSVIDKLVVHVIPACETIMLNRTDLEKKLKEARDTIVHEDKQASIRENAVKHVYRAVHATWSVEKKTFTDNVLKVVRDTVLNARQRWVTHTLLTDDAVINAAVEDEDVAERRRECGACIGRMEDVLKEIAVIEGAA